jgi:hypothetical protein
VYKREDLGTGVRGKYFESYTKGTNLVLLSPDVAKVFTTEEEVNEALRSLINLAKKSTGRTLKRIADRAGSRLLCVSGVEYKRDNRQ